MRHHRRHGIALFTALLLSSTAAWADGAARLERVFLSAGGVALMDYALEVPADGRVTLAVPDSQADDILKSLTVYDAGGVVDGVGLPGETARADLLRDLAIDEGDLASTASLLEALKGAEVTIAGPRGLAGRILAVTAEEATTETGQILRHRLALMTAQGVQSVLIEESTGIGFADPATAQLLETALRRLAGARQPSLRQIELRLGGDAAREARLGYVVEAPLWKTSWRITLGQESARLQGWAIVDNRSGIDWQDVEVTVSAGAPVTLWQALARTYFVQRPEIPVRLLQGVVPRVDRGAVTAMAASEAAPGGPAGAMPAPRAMMRKGLATADGAEMAGIAQAEARETIGQAVFRLPRPVSVKDGGTVMVPFLDQSLPSRRVALYQPDQNPGRALAAIRVANDGAVSLPPGILTIQERTDGRSAFLGDAELDMIPPGQSRLVPFAVDTALRVVSDSKRRQRLAQAKLVDGLLTLDLVEQAVVRHTFETGADQARDLVLEQPKLAGFTLTSPAAAAETDRFWRIEQAMPAGSRQTVEVVMERPVRRELALLEVDPEQLHLAFAGTTLPPALEALMERIAQARGVQVTAQQVLNRLEQARALEVDEQARIRQNLEALPASSDLAARFLRSLAQSEDRLESLARDLAQARIGVDQASSALAQLVREARI